MRTVILPKANDIIVGSGSMSTIEPVIIEISDQIPKIETLEQVKEYYDKQAQILVDTLLANLPQGIIEPVIIKLLQKRVSLYCGTMGSTLEVMSGS